MKILGPGTVAFLASLRANNSRDWFEANKESFRDAVKAPAEAFASDMVLALETTTGFAHASRIFRIHRDLRFSKDKTPYNAHLHISFTPKGRGADTPAWMIGLEPERLVLGVGTFAFTAKALARWRIRIDGADGTALASILSSLAKKGVRVDPPDLKRVPAPYAEMHPRGDLLRRKALAVWIDVEPSVAFGRSGPQACTKRLQLLRPVFDWLVSLSS